MPDFASASFAVKSVESKRTGIAAIMFAVGWEAACQIIEHAFLASISDKAKDQVADMGLVMWLGQHPHIGWGIGLAIWLVVIVYKLGREHADTHADQPRYPAMNISGSHNPITSVAGDVHGGVNVDLSAGKREASRDYHEEIHHHHTHVQPDPLFQSRLVEFEKLDELFVKKDELQLRETFDFQDMLKFNIIMTRNYHWPGTVPILDLEKMNAFFKDGNGLILRQFIDVHVAGGNTYMKAKPGNSPYVNVSKKCSEARALLLSLASSAKIPTSVATALKELEQTVACNIEMIGSALNECSTSDPKSLTENESHAAWNYYWGKFIHLKPKAEAIGLAIRIALDASSVLPKPPGSLPL